MADIMRGDEAVDDNSGMRMRRGRAGSRRETSDLRQKLDLGVQHTGE
jgi:hypothetical protein